MSDTDSPEGKPLPTNEEIIDEITKDLEKTLIDPPVEPETTDTSTSGAEQPPTAVESREEGRPNPTVEESSCIPPDFEDDDNDVNADESSNQCDFDDTIDEVALKDSEMTYDEETRKKLCGEAKDLKETGNQQFKAGEFRESAITYTKALRICPLFYENDRAVLYANRAAAKGKLGLSKSAIEDCTKAIELNDNYLKVYLRRAQLYKETDKLDEALEDYNKVLKIEPHHPEARGAVMSLPNLINERNEKLKTEMLAKLKDVGNLFLRPFGLSTDDFQLNQDPSTGGYSISMGKQ